jgi:DNA-binding transcriptional regulator YhcF (GntR family)
MIKDNSNIESRIREDFASREVGNGASQPQEVSTGSGSFCYSMDESWVKIHRKILEHWIYKRPEYVSIWIYLIARANWKASKALVNGSIVTIERGEVLTSIASLADNTHTSRQTVRTFLRLAQTDGMICVKSNTGATCVKLLNYDKLQQRENYDQHAPNTRLTRDQHAPNNIIRSKEVKKERIEEQIDSVSMRSRAFTRPTLQEILGYFIELGSTSDEANKFFDHYTANGWKVGKNAMKDWKATARNWNRNSNNYNKPAGRTNGTGQKGDRGRYDSLEYANQLAQLGNRGLPDKPVKPTYLVGDSVPRQIGRASCRERV